MNTDLHRAIVGDGVYLKAQRVRRAVPFNLVQREHLPTSSGQLFNGVTQRNTVNRSIYLLGRTPEASEQLRSIA